MSKKCKAKAVAHKKPAPRAEYEAAKPSRLRKMHREGRSPNQLVDQGAAAIRAQVRHLERNHDLTRGAIRTLVNNFVGPAGISIEPQPRRADGSIHEEYAALLRAEWRDWQRRPEVTWRHTWPAAQRMLARVWIRDGEAFAQELIGKIPGLDHGTNTPYSLELFEPDMVPLDYNDPGNNVRQGIRTNAWGRTIGAYVYKTHPGDAPTLLTGTDLKFIPADRLIHLMRPDRLHQLRGVSEFSSVITRLQDLKEYENSEQVAAKMAADLTLYIKRGSPELYDPNTDDRPTDAEGVRQPREIEFEAGTILDGLSMGEEIGMIDSKRPNLNAITWRHGQLRAFSTGVGASYSSISHDYDGTYSAQRQELVEQHVHYAVLTDEFTGQVIKPVWERFVAVAALSGRAPIPADVVAGTADDALFVGQSMPWIDPVKEANAWLILVRAGFASEVEVLRRRGVNPMDVLEQVSSWRARCKEKNISFDSNAAIENAIDSALADAPDTPEEDARKSGSSPKNRTRTRATSR